MENPKVKIVDGLKLPPAPPESKPKVVNTPSKAPKTTLFNNAPDG